MDLSKLRNIGISAHIDSGKTTLSERILFYAGRIHLIKEVKGDGATMDHMELEKERGITITSAATSVKWRDPRDPSQVAKNGVDATTSPDHAVNLIDTPGHVDFTVEVERSLRVLDGAILVLCSVGGVQSQSLTIDRQMKRYHVPRLAFINKMDRTGANPERVAQQLRDKLGCNAVMMQLNMGKEHLFQGMIDLVTMKAYFFDGDDGEKERVEEIPAEYKEAAVEARREMLEALSMYSDELMEMLLAEQEPPVDLIYRVVKQGVQQQDLTPVFLGSAYKNKGVQPLLDAVVRYLPSPLEKPQIARDHADPEKRIELKADPKLPTVAMAFKIVEDPYGSLTFCRIYQGSIKKGETYYNQRTQRKERFSRIVRMHANEREDIDSAGAGDIVAVIGLDCASGDTYSSEYPYATLESMFIAEPVIKVAVRPLARDGADKLSKALQRFRREDPTFRVGTDEESGETIIAGMGELHLEIYVERIRREYKVECEVGAPKVSYREAPTQACEYEYKHKKQTGGSGQYAHVKGKMELLPEDSTEHFEFEDKVIGGRIPRQFIPSVEKGFRDSLDKGPLAGFPIVGVKAVLEDGSYHDVDSSDMAFQVCGRYAFREAFLKMKPVLLEPIMKVEIECPSDFQGSVVGDLTSRRGMVVATETQGMAARIEGEVPLAETFGYSTELRSMTQGQGTFTLEFARYRRVPGSVQVEVIAERKKQMASV